MWLRRKYLSKTGDPLVTITGHMPNTIISLIWPHSAEFIYLIRIPVFTYPHLAIKDGASAIN